MTTEEALMVAQVNDTGINDVVIIDNDLRTIIIPASITLLGVESDENVQTLHFQMPKTYKGLDLSEFDIRINYMNANNVGDTYAVDDSEISGENIVFTWTVGRVACMYKGNTKFIVCLKKKDASGNVLKEFNTSLASLPVLEGLETTESVVAENPDIIEQILTRLDNVTEIPQEKVSSAVEEYMTKNPINIPKKLPNPHKLTFAGAVTAEYDGTIYKVLQAHTSQDTWIPPDAPSLFAKVLIPNENVIPEWEQPDSTNPYAKGDKVTHNGKTWISTADGNVWEPGVYGWEEV